MKKGKFKKIGVLGLVCGILLCIGVINVRANDVGSVSNITNNTHPDSISLGGYVNVESFQAGIDSIYGTERIESQSFKLFDVKRHVDNYFSTETVLTKSGYYGDYGMDYLMHMLDVADSEYALGEVNLVHNNLNNDGLTNSHLINWIKQAAVYYYLAGTEGNNTSTKADSSKLNTYKTIVMTCDAIKNDGGNIDDLSATDLSAFGYFRTTNNKTLFEAVKVNGLTINQIVNYAKTHKNKTNLLSLTSDGADIKLVENDKYYQSSKYTIAFDDLTAQSASTAAIVLSGAPEGTKIVNESGTELNPECVGTNEVFYIRVPVKKVTKNTNITFKVKYTNSRLVAYYYEPTSPIKKYVTSGSKLFNHEISSTQSTNSNDPSKLTDNSFNLTKVDDAAAKSYIGYIIGIIAVILGSVIVYKTIIHKEELEII